MRGSWWILVLTVAGCHAHPSTRQSLAPATPGSASNPATSAAAAIDLPETEPVIPIFDGRGPSKYPPRTVAEREGKTFRRLREDDCLILSSANAPTTRLLEQEDRLPPRPGSSSAARAQLWSGLRYFTALELRNRASAEALERFMQLAELEARTDLLRQTFAILDALAAKARAAKAANVRYPFDVADLDRERSQLEAQLEQAVLTGRLLNLDLKRRLGMPPLPVEARLWPSGDFTIDPTPIDPETVVAAAMADRPELRGLRQFQQDLTVDSLPDVRDLLHAGSPLLGDGASGTPSRLLAALRAWCELKKSGDTKQAELDVRKQQLQDVIVERERLIADEARAAALAANTQRIRAALARDRVAAWEEKLADAEKKRSAGQPGAEFLVPQVQLELLKARSELVSEVAAWHQARIRVKGAQGWLVWEAISKAR